MQVYLVAMKGDATPTLSHCVVIIEYALPAVTHVVRPGSTREDPGNNIANGIDFCGETCGGCLEKISLFFSSYEPLFVVDDFEPWYSCKRVWEIPLKC